MIKLPFDQINYLNPVSKQLVETIKPDAVIILHVRFTDNATSECPNQLAERLG